jgi:soluble lytic murein transglycosylase-like protein
MNRVESIYIEKLSRFQSVLQEKAAKCGGNSCAFADILDEVEQRMAVSNTDAQPAAVADAYGASVYTNYVANTGFASTSYQSLKTSASTSEIDAAVSNAARATGLDPALIKAVIQVESSFRPDAVSGAGAQGLMQLMPGTAKSLGVTNSFDVSQNVMGGSTYIKQQLERFGDIRLALAAYNTGPGRIGRLNITNPDNPAEYNQISEGVRGYVDKVLAYYKQFAAE